METGNIEQFAVVALFEERRVPFGPNPSHFGGLHAEHTNHRRSSRLRHLGRQGFYVEFLGLRTEEFNLGWVARYTSPITGANLQLVTRDATALETPAISVLTPDVEAAYEEATRLGYEIIHPLTTETCGVRRFSVKAPDGTIVNIVQDRG